MSKKDVHVVPRDGAWAVVRPDADRASSVHDTQREAIDAGRRIAQRERSELLVHGENGKIRSKDSFGNDPNPPKDREH